MDNDLIKRCCGGSFLFCQHSWVTIVLILGSRSPRFWPSWSIAPLGTSWTSRREYSWRLQLNDFIQCVKWKVSSCFHSTSCPRAWAIDIPSNFSVHFVHGVLGWISLWIYLNRHHVTRLSCSLAYSMENDLIKRCCGGSFLFCQHSWFMIFSSPQGHDLPGHTQVTNNESRAHL